MIIISCVVGHLIKSVISSKNYFIFIFYTIKMPNFFKKVANNASNIFSKVDKGASNFFTKTAPNIGSQLSSKI